jgi:hypothetical protein
MQLPRSGQLDDRRRRVLTDEVIGASPAETAPSTAAARPPSKRRATPAPLYGDDSLTDRQPRVTDLVPRRYLTVFLPLLIGLLLVAALEAIYAWLPELAAYTRDGELTALDLAAEGSLGSWFSSTTLLLASVTALLVYAVRRHRQDDYHGRYRVWLWAAALWLLMSVDEGASLHEGFQELMSAVSGQGGWGGGAVWSIAGYGLVLLTVGTRLVLEMRSCRGSTTALALGIGCYAVAVAVKQKFVPGLYAGRAVMVKEGCEMAGNVWLLWAMLLHARYVVLEAEGALPVRVKREKKVRRGDLVSAATPAAAAEKAKPESDSAEAPAKRSWFSRAKVDAAHATPPAPAGKGKSSDPKSATVTRRQPRRAEQAAELEYEVDEHGDADGDADAGRARLAKKPAGVRSDDDYDDDSSGPRLTKAQRKAMRRERDRQRGEEDE